MNWLRSKVNALIWRVRWAMTPTQKLGNMTVKVIDKGMYVVDILPMEVTQ